MKKREEKAIQLESEIEHLKEQAARQNVVIASLRKRIQVRYLLILYMYRRSVKHSIFLKFGISFEKTKRIFHQFNFSFAEKTEKSFRELGLKKQNKQKYLSFSNYCFFAQNLVSLNVSGVYIEIEA